MRCVQCPTLILIVLLSTVAAAQQAGPWYDFIASTYELHNEDLDEYLVGEIDRFAAAHPHDGRVADVLVYKARLLEADGEEHAALLAWLEIAFMHPDHAQASAARDAVLRIASRERDYEETLTDLRERTETAPPSIDSDRMFAFLDLVTTIMHNDLRELSLPLYRQFGRLYPADARQVRTLEWESRVLAAEGDELEAATTLAKAEALFPGDAAIPLVKHRRALLLADELDQPERALAVLVELRADQPEHPVAAAALRDMARIKADEKDYPGAAGDLRAFADAYPDHEQTIDVLFELAEISYDRLEAWDRTDAIYEEIVTRYPDDERAVEALRESAKLNEKKREDLARAAAQYARVGELFPGVEDADRDLFRAADIAADKLGDKALAEEYLRAVMRIWPDTEAARDAADDLEDLQKD
jgi:TolA-binding protein